LILETPYKQPPPNGSFISHGYDNSLNGIHHFNSLQNSVINSGLDGNSIDNECAALLHSCNSVASSQSTHMNIINSRIFAEAYAAAARAAASVVSGSTDIYSPSSQMTNDLGSQNNEERNRSQHSLLYSMNQEINNGFINVSKETNINTENTGGWKKYNNSNSSINLKNRDKRKGFQVIACLVMQFVDFAMNAVLALPFLSLTSASGPSCSSIMFTRTWSIFAVICMSEFSASAGMLLGPAAFPFLIFLMAVLIYSTIGGVTSIGSYVSSSPVSHVFHRPSEFFADADLSGSPLSFGEIHVANDINKYKHSLQGIRKHSRISLSGQLEPRGSHLSIQLPSKHSLNYSQWSNTSGASYSSLVSPSQTDLQVAAQVAAAAAVVSVVENMNLSLAMNHASSLNNVGGYCLMPRPSSRAASVTGPTTRNINKLWMENEDGESMKFGMFTPRNASTGQVSVILKFLRVKRICFKTKLTFQQMLNVVKKFSSSQ
ncbi:unnamed protein product, partial [Schistosoma curassoni]|uniref:Uncharacterized protein n=1 Tax=Schistosoma curassoni TaxID=6186 RepID=A0A183KR89_9TREM